MTSLSVNLTCEPPLAVLPQIAFLITQSPVRAVQPVTTSSFTEEKRHEQACMTAVHDTLYVDTDTEEDTPIMWSSFHAARSDVVGQPQKCIEALLPLFSRNDSTWNGIGERDNRAPQSKSCLCAGNRPTVV